MAFSTLKGPNCTARAAPRTHYRVDALSARCITERRGLTAAHPGSARKKKDGLSTRLTGTRHVLAEPRRRTNALINLGVR